MNKIPKDCRKFRLDVFKDLNLGKSDNGSHTLIYLKDEDGEWHGEDIETGKHYSLNRGMLKYPELCKVTVLG